MIHTFGRKLRRAGERAGLSGSFGELFQGPPPPDPSVRLEHRGRDVELVSKDDRCDQVRDSSAVEHRPEILEDLGSNPSLSLFARLSPSIRGGRGEGQNYFVFEEFSEATALVRLWSWPEPGTRSSQLGVRVGP